MAAQQADLPAGLLEYIKTMLDVTWEDPVTDRKYTEMIQSGMAFLNEKYGASGDYSVPGELRTLLKEYVRYDRDGALDVFETNYLNRLLALQNNRKVGDYVEGTVPATGE